MAETRQPSNNDKVTMAVLGVKIDVMAEKLDEHNARSDKLWDTHIVLHREQEERMRFLEHNCHNMKPHDERIREVEAEQRVLKHRIGVVGGLNAIATAIGTAFATFVGRNS